MFLSTISHFLVKNTLNFLLFEEFLINFSNIVEDKSRKADGFTAKQKGKESAQNTVILQNLKKLTKLKFIIHYIEQV